MPPAPLRCLLLPSPTDDELRAVALPDADTRSEWYLRVLAHLDRCPACAARREAIDTGGDWLRQSLHPPGPPGLAPGSMIGMYAVLEKVAAGGQGVVYRVHDPALGRDVALKLSGAAGDFQAEARAQAGLTHPHITPLHSFGEHEGWPFFVMELARTSLARSLRTPLAPRSAEEVALLVEQLAQAVHYAHQAGIHHRDLKPQNVLLTFEGEETAPRNLAAKLADFGLAGVGQLAGSPNYLAPEIAAALAAHPGDSGPHDPVRIDVYGLGAILHELLTGEPPFPGQDRAMVLKAVADPAEPPVLACSFPPLRVPKLPTTLRAITMKCLAHDPSRRYATAAALADDLRRYRERWLTQAHPPGLFSRLAWGVGLFFQRQPASAVLLAVLLLFAIGGPITAGAFYALAEERDTQRKRAEAEERNERSRAAALALERGTTLALQTRPGEGLPWMVRALELAPASDPIRGAIRHGISHWLHRAPRLGEVIPHDKKPYGLAFSPDGRRLYSAGKGGRLQTWDAATGRPVGNPVDLPASVERLLFGKDGKTLYAPGTDGKLYRFSAEGDELRPLPTWGGHNASILAIALTPDGKHIATGGEDGVLLIRETATGNKLVAFQPHGRKRNGRVSPVSRTIRDVAFSPDGKQIATAGWDMSVRLARWGTWVNGPLLDHGKSMPWAVCFLAVGRRTLLLSADQGGTVRVWDEKGKRLPMGLRLNGWITRLAPRPGPFPGQVLITGYGEAARVWDGGARETSAEFPHPQPVEGAAWAPDGTQLATACADGVRIWHLPAVGTKNRLAYSGLADDETYLPGGSALSRAGDRAAVAERGARGRVWVSAIGPDGVKAIQGPPPQGVGIQSACFSPSGRLLLLGAIDGSVRLWDFATGKERWRTSPVAPRDPNMAPPQAIRALGFSPDGKFYATGDLRGRIVLGEATTGAAVHVSAIEGICPFDLAFTHDGKQLVVAALDRKQGGLLTWWDTANGKEIGPRRSLLNVPLQLDLSPDGKAVAIASLDRRVAAWDMATHMPTGPAIRLPTGASVVRFSPDGQLLLTVSSDDVARLWHWGTGQPVGMPFRTEPLSNTASFAPDGRRLVLVGSDMVRQWPLPGGPLRDLATARHAVRLATGHEVGSDDRLVPLSAAEWVKEAGR